MGEFFEIHPGPHFLACRELASELRARRCRLPAWRRLHGAPASDGPRFVALAEAAYGRPVHARFVQTTALHYDASRA